MLRYLLAFALVASTIYVGVSIVGRVVAHEAPSPLDITLASGIYTMAIAARVTL